MIASVMLLSLGAGEANGSAGESAAALGGTLWIALAVTLACVAGVVFGTLSLAIRHSATRGVSLGLLAMWIPAMGTAALGPMCLWRYGVSGPLATPSDFLLMLLCGLLNLIAYLAIIKGLQMTTMLHANVVTASEAAMAAVAGLLFFQEAATPALVAGVCLSVAGMVLMDRPVAA
jgi:drug/metabolite transporter (DMT)-like permease